MIASSLELFLSLRSVINKYGPLFIEFVIEISREIQKDIRFKDGVNVNFLSKEKDNLYRIRTYERGVENETLSCGTGAVAAAITLNILSLVNSDCINLKTKGGDLTVDLKRSENIFINTQYFLTQR